MKKIILIGPVYPYKGGISHYTGLLYRELIKKYDVVMVSYKMQYPRFLFKKEQKDYTNDRFKIDGTKFMIHTANPFNIWKTGKWIRKQRPDMVLVQWWHPYFAPCYVLLGMAMGRQNLVYLCHNVLPHESFPFAGLLTKAVLKKGKHFIVQANQEKQNLERLLKKPDVAVTPHPTYDAFQMTGIERSRAKEKLNLDMEQKVLLFFGFVREYKGLKHLLKAMPDIISKEGNVILLIAGDFGDQKDEYTHLIETMGIKTSVRVEDGYIPDQDVEIYFAACDLVVLPYESATQSGIAQIAFGFERPVVVTNTGGLPDVVEHDKTGYVVEPCNPKALAAAVTDFYDRGRREELESNIKQQADRFSWSKMEERVSAFFEKE